MYRRNRKTRNSARNFRATPDEDYNAVYDSGDDKKKDKKLVFLSKSVLQKVRERPMVTGTQIANEILEMYKSFCDVSDC